MRLVTGLGKAAPWDYRPRVPPGGTPLRLGLSGTHSKRLSQGQLSREPLPEASVRKIQARISSILSAANAQLDEVAYEIDMALDPETAPRVSVVGQTLTRNEILALEIEMASEIGRIAESISRAAGPYWNGDHEVTLIRLQRRITDLIALVPDSDVAPVAPDHSVLAAQRTAEVTESLREMKQDLERAIVEAEAQGVPVEEPMRVPWAYLGVAAAGVVVLTLFLSGE